MLDRLTLILFSWSVRVQHYK